MNHDLDLDLDLDLDPRHSLYALAHGRRRPDAAWRQAAESWLRCQGLITIAHNPNVSPNYPAKRHQE